MNMQKVGLAGAAVAAALITATVPAAAQSTLEQAIENGYIRVGFANEAPFGYATPSGELTGEAPAIAKVILERMGIPEVDGVLTEFGSLIPGLQAGRFDIIAAGMFINPQRCEQIAFSEPSYGIGQAFLVQEGNPMGLNNYEDVANNPEATLGVMSGAVEKGYAEAAGVPEDQIMSFPDGPSGLAAVRTGRADAFALTSLSIANLVETVGEGAGVEMTQPFGEVAGQSVKGHGAFGFRKDDEELLQAFNAELAEFIGSEEHIALVTPFGFGEDYLPNRTTADLCQAEE
ncbi:MAG TPA: ectoine/hydroxyectoine ABC transporter substrate-binding protein EhuB [Alphaproteobacteria bacterium]|nr:ectoine/hydroxyectoine ABC transporter substrate-binding protein EhuB [Alphaproteobacteria bacterium]